MSYAPLSQCNFKTYRHWLGGLLGDTPRELGRALRGDGVAEDMEIERQTGVRLHFAHYRTAPDSAGQISKIMDPIDLERREESDITFDIYPYPTGSSIPLSLLPGEAQE